MLSLFFVLLLVIPAWGFYRFQEQIPNGNNVPHPCKPNYRWPGLGHLNPNGGGARNSFGEDFQTAELQWTTDLCTRDSDGDGLTNGQELGDPSCTWRPGQILQLTKDITHPGVCEPMDSPQCQGRNDFVDCELETFEDCQRIKRPGVMNFTVRLPPTPVPNTETNYFCMTFDLPQDQDYHIIADEGVIDNREVMHHILLFGCTDDSPLRFDSPRSCGMAAESGGCQNVIGGWTVGNSGSCLG